MTDLNISFFNPTNNHRNYTPHTPSNTPTFISTENPEIDDLEDYLTLFSDQDKNLNQGLDHVVNRFDWIQYQYEKLSDKLKKTDNFFDFGRHRKPSYFEKKIERSNHWYEEEEKYGETLENTKDKYDLPDYEINNLGTIEQQAFVAEALNRHAQEVGAIFAKDSDWQAFITDIYGDNIDPDLDIFALRDEFVAGTLRPEVRFVSQSVLTDPRGKTRDVAFAASLKTLLLSDNLDHVAIEQAILADIGHWWDVQLSSQDTVASDGAPFDEGVAYAERFADGVEGNIFYSRAAFLNDKYPIVLDGEDIDIEFAPDHSPDYSDAGKAYLDEIFPDAPSDTAPLLVDKDANGNQVIYSDLTAVNNRIDELVDDENVVFASSVINSDGTRYQVGWKPLEQGHVAWEDDSQLKTHLKTYAKVLVTNGAVATTTSEALGEIATAIAVVEKYKNAKLKLSIDGNVQDIDQVWEDIDPDSGESTLIIAEAKGGTSTLSDTTVNTFNGQQIDFQMSPEWVVDRLGRQVTDENTIEKELIEKYGIFKKLVDTQDGNQNLGAQKYVINGLKENSQQKIEGLVINTQSLLRGELGDGDSPFYTNKTDTIPLSSGDMALNEQGAINYKPLFKLNLAANEDQTVDQDQRTFNSKVNINDVAISAVFAEWQKTPEFRALLENITSEGAITIQSTTGATLNGTPKPNSTSDFPPNVTTLWSPSDRTIKVEFPAASASASLDYNDMLSNLLFELVNAQYDKQYQHLSDLAFKYKGDLQNPANPFDNASDFADAVSAIESQAFKDWALLAKGDSPILVPVKADRLRTTQLLDQLPDLFIEGESPEIGLNEVQDASYNFYKAWYVDNIENTSVDGEPLRFDTNKFDTLNLIDNDSFNQGTGVDTGITDGGDVNVESTFYTFSDINQSTDIRELNPDEDIDPTFPTYIVTHGFTDGANTDDSWQKALGSSILRQQEANVVLVDWDAPAFDTLGVLWDIGENYIEDKFLGGGVVQDAANNYENAVRNTEVIGDRIAKLINNTDSINPRTTTLIGHSLGGQVSGWAGKKYQELREDSKIRSIVGLDPAGPSFQESLADEFYKSWLRKEVIQELGVNLSDYKAAHQLNADDADRVTAIHTTDILGISNPITGAEGTTNSNTLDLFIDSGKPGLLQQPSAHSLSHQFFQQLIDGDGYNENIEESQKENTKPISELKNPSIGNESNVEFPLDSPDGTAPLVSLNTILQGNGAEGAINRGIVDITGVVANPAENFEIYEGEILTFEGTDLNDTLAGTKERMAATPLIIADSISGAEGDDLLLGLEGNDSLKGGLGNDTLHGGEGNDKLWGERATTIDDLGALTATGNDLLFGEAGDDTLEGGNGNDTLVGGTDNDSLRGGIFGIPNNVNRLVGVDPRQESPGLNEIDTLRGTSNQETDIFGLGDSLNNYYVNEIGDETPSYAIIENFELGIDKIEIKSDTELSIMDIDTDFDIPTITNGIAIAVGRGEGELRDLIGIVQSEESLTPEDLLNSTTTFVRV